MSMFTVFSSYANVQLRLEPLNWFFSMAELHRRHQSKTIIDANHNYGQTIGIWHWVFDTRFLPSHQSPPDEIGIAELPAYPMTWWAQILSPFRFETD